MDYEALGRKTAEAHGYTGDLDYAEYGRHVSDAMGKRASVPPPEKFAKAAPKLAKDAVAPEIVAPAAAASGLRRLPARVGGAVRGAYQSLPEPADLTDGSIANNRWVTAILAALGVLVVGSQLSGQYFNLAVGRGAYPQPAAPPTPTYKPLFPGQQIDPTAPPSGATQPAHSGGGGGSNSAAYSGSHGVMTA